MEKNYYKLTINAISSILDEIFSRDSSLELSYSISRSQGYEGSSPNSCVSIHRGCCDKCALVIFDSTDSLDELKEKFGQLRKEAKANLDLDLI